MNRRAGGEHEAAATPRQVQSEPVVGRSLAEHLLALQQAIGNAATAQAVAQRDPSPQRQTTKQRSQRPAATRPPASGQLPDINDILPRGGGLIRHIDTALTLVEIFGHGLLERHVRQIRADPSARLLTRSHGVPAIVALYDTSSDGRLNAQEARRALKRYPERYSRRSFERLRFLPAGEERHSYWFQDPAIQRPVGGRSKDIVFEGPDDTDDVLAGAEERRQVFVEPRLSQVGSLFVRFAYPRNEMSSGRTSDRVTDAKSKILEGLRDVIQDIGSLPPAASREERRLQVTARARLKAALKAFGRSTPLNVSIATEPSETELITGQVAAETGRIYVNLRDVGDPRRLQAALRIPATLLFGGLLPGHGGGRRVQAASSEDMKRTLLHEALHAMLIRIRLDADAIWAAAKGHVGSRGSPSARPKFEELVRKFLIAQEEIFAYEMEATLYPPESPDKRRYESFIRNTRSFLQRRGLQTSRTTHAIPIGGRGGQGWSIAYEVPSGTAQLTVDHLTTIDFLLGTYRL